MLGLCWKLKLVDIRSALVDENSSNRWHLFSAYSLLDTVPKLSMDYLMYSNKGINRYYYPYFTDKGGEAQ